MRLKWEHRFLLFMIKHLDTNKGLVLSFLAFWAGNTILSSFIPAFKMPYSLAAWLMAVVFCFARSMQLTSRPVPFRDPIPAMEKLLALHHWARTDVPSQEVAVMLHFVQDKTMPHHMRVKCERLEGNDWIPLPLTKAQNQMFLEEVMPPGVFPPAMGLIKPTLLRFAPPTAHERLTIWAQHGQTT